MDPAISVNVPGTTFTFKNVNFGTAFDEWRLTLGASGLNSPLTTDPLAGYEVTVKIDGVDVGKILVGYQDSTTSTSLDILRSLTGTHQVQLVVNWANPTSQPTTEQSFQLQYLEINAIAPSEVWRVPVTGDALTQLGVLDLGQAREIDQVTIDFFSGDGRTHDGFAVEVCAKDVCNDNDWIKVTTLADESRIVSGSVDVDFSLRSVQYVRVSAGGASKDTLAISAMTLMASRSSKLS